MKQNLIAFLFFLLTNSNYVSAQEKQNNPVRLGLRTGIFSSQFQIQTTHNATFTGDDMYYAGIQVQIPITPKFYLIPEILYAKSSVTYHDSQLGGSILGAEDLTHILLPVQLKYQAGKFGFYVGGQLDLLANARATYYPTYQNTDFTDSSYKKVSFSGIVGAEFVFKYRFGIDVRYHHSLLNMRASNGSSPITDNGSVKLSAFQAGIFFRFGKKPIKK